ncbi:hypothetical protein QIA25_02125 [Borreliella spielmanii]|uniref:Uncharacterized protein n=1 Tax=Borreliella spielmanii A14S TaxID=498742 RepID=C0APT8_9SPIR|nr:hypothetical protein [Borreliella spielmanii]EEF84680.1 conserved hypothetical protein [Borreliella spielmanii A14S]WKC83393.1 hypothetical protein QIA25_02125 [Borreliella spielmanii]
MILIFFIFFFSILDLYPFLEFRNDEKFALVKDFGVLDNNKLNIGIRLRPLGKTVSVFSNNYKILYSKNRPDRDSSILIIFDNDSNLNLEVLGGFFYKLGKIFLKDEKSVIDLVVNDPSAKKIINPLFVIKNRNNVVADTVYTLGGVFLKGKGDDERLELSKNINLNVDFGQYSLLLYFYTQKVESFENSLKGIYYFETILNNKSIFRSDFQNIFLINNTYVLAQEKNYGLDILNIKKDGGCLKINDLNFIKGKNELKIKYGDVYGNEKKIIYRFKLNE